MSEGVYENAVSFHNTKPAGNTDENICMNEVTKESQQRTPHSSGGQDRRYKLAVVLVCVLLLAVTITLCITSLKTKDLQFRYQNLAEEKDQLQNQNNNIKADKSQLEERNAILIHIESQLETNFSAVTAERDELQMRLCELVDVTLDPDTAQPNLILSADGKQVKYGDTRQNLPDTPKRFIKYIFVLGREGFTSGKFYYEVQVKGKIGWSIGVAKESVDRKGQIYLNPKYGLWTIWLRNGTYQANADPPVPLSLKGTPQRVGVFVDYDAGLVSFYDADCWDHIYSFTKVSFTEKIYPYFSPDKNEGGKNSAPLIISPVHVCPIK